MEAVINNCPAFAISQEYYEHPDFALAGRGGDDGRPQHPRARPVAGRARQRQRAGGDARGVRRRSRSPASASASTRTSSIERLDPRGIPYFWIGGPPPSGLAVEGTDFHAVINRRIAVTPIHLDLTGRRPAEAAADVGLAARGGRVGATGVGVPSASPDAHAQTREDTTMDDLTKLMIQLGGATERAGGTDPMAALSGLQQAVQQEGGLDGLMGKLRDAGLGDQVDSWVATGQNQPVDPAALGQALGPDTVQRLSAGSGIDIASLLPLLAAFLPADHRHAHPGRPGPGRRPRPARACRTSAGCSAASSAAAGGAGGTAGPRRPRRRCSAACSAATRAADARPGVEPPGHRRTRPCADTTAVGGRRPARRACSGHGPDCSLAATRIRRFLEEEPVVWLSTVRPGRDAAHRPDLVLVGRRGRCWSSPSRTPQKVRNLRAESGRDARRGRPG